MDEDYSGYLKLINNCDKDDPLLSDTPLGACPDRIPLECVPSSEFNRLTLALSVEQLIPTESGLKRDYRGMAELMGFSTIEIETRFKKSYNSTKSLIDAYIYRNSNQAAGGHNNRVTVTDLLKIIEQLERFDVIDDFMPTLVELASRKTTNKIQNISCSLENLIVQVKDTERLTFDDTIDSATEYDAFICYAPQDFSIAQDLKSELQQRDKRIATADDLIPGHFEHDALMRLIDLRCRKVILIVTPNFCQSKEGGCDFQYKFASGVAIKGNELKIIPVIYGRIPPDQMPSMISIMSKINLDDPLLGRAVQFERLIRSLDHNPSANSISQLDSRLMQPNGRTSSFNGRLAVEYASPSSASPSSAFRHHTNSFSNGNSPIPAANRTNDPIVEFPNSQNSTAAMRFPSSRRSPVDYRGTGAIAFLNTDAPTPSSKNWITQKIGQLRNTFSSKRRDVSETNVNYKDSSSCTSQLLLIRGDSNDLSTDEDIQSRNVGE